MAKTGNENGKWQSFCRKMKPVWEETKEIFGMIGRGCRVAASYVARLHKVILAVPVVFVTVKMAVYNAGHLPEQVGLGIQKSGEFAQLISRDVAVLCPVAVTAACLLLMFCSRRSLYPWLVSVFSLALPVLLLITNVYPA